ncbi:MAG: hypothetical protein ACFFE3_13000 [Candidatus Thorarchaeota archaeon]
MPSKPKRTYYIKLQNLNRKSFKMRQAPNPLELAKTVESNLSSDRYQQSNSLNSEVKIRKPWRPWNVEEQYTQT